MSIPAIGLPFLDDDGPCLVVAYTPRQSLPAYLVFFLFLSYSSTSPFTLLWFFARVFLFLWSRTLTNSVKFLTGLFLSGLMPRRQDRTSKAI